MGSIEIPKRRKRKVITETHAKSNQLIVYRINAIKSVYFDLTLIKCYDLYHLFFFTIVVVVVMFGRPTINQLPDDKMLDWFKLKEVADDISRCL